MHRIAIGGWVVAGVLALWIAVYFGLVAYSPNGQSITVQPPAHGASAAKDASKAKRQPGRPPNYADSVKEVLEPARAGPPPADYNYYTDEDLKAQRSVAQSTAKIVEFTMLQVVLTAIGSALLFLTIFYTREATNAATKAVAVAIQVERPILHIRDVLLGSKSGNYENEPFGRLNDALLTIWVENFGKTLAFVDHVVINAAICIDLPEKPEYQSHTWLSGDKPIKPEATESFDELTYRNEGLPGDIRRVAVGLDNLWVYGFVDYFDFLGDHHRKGFCARWDSLNNSFHAYRKAGYDYLIDVPSVEKPDPAKELADIVKRRAAEAGVGTE